MTHNRRPASVWPFALMVFGLILIVGAGIWYLNPAVSVNGDQEPGNTFEDSLSEIARVSLADAKAAYNSGSALFVDVRDPESYRQQHIPGAISLPLAQFPAGLEQLNPSDWIIPY